MLPIAALELEREQQQKARRVEMNVNCADD